MINITLKQANDLFILDRMTYCSFKTVSNYKCNIGYFIDFISDKYKIEYGDIDIKEITVKDLQDYFFSLKNRDKFENHDYKHTEHGTHVTNTTIRTYFIALRTFFSYLADEELTEVDIMKNYKIIQREQNTIIPLYDSEVVAIDNLFNLKTETGCRNWCIIHLMLDAGLRSGEVCNLNIEDIDLEHSIIHIRAGKGNKSRLMPIAPSLKSNLYKYINLFRPINQVNNLFVSVDSKNHGITDNTIKSLFSRIRKKTGIIRLKPHLLRHTFATSFIVGGGNLEVLRLYLGHTSYDITRSYLHIATFYNNASVKIYALDSMFFQSMYS